MRLNSKIVQFGISPNKSMEAQWSQSTFKDDDNKRRKDFKEGMISFAGYAENSRTCQVHESKFSHLQSIRLNFSNRKFKVFIVFDDNPYLGKNPWEMPFGIVSRGMESVHAISKSYAGSFCCVLFSISKT